MWVGEGGKKGEKGDEEEDKNGDWRREWKDVREMRDGSKVKKCNKDEFTYPLPVSRALLTRYYRGLLRRKQIPAEKKKGNLLMLHNYQFSNRLIRKDHSLIRKSFVVWEEKSILHAPLAHSIGVDDESNGS